MAYEIIVWGPFTCPPNSSQYPDNGFTLTGGTSPTIVSVGFQNIGLLTSTYASQMFVGTGGTSCLVQVVNNSQSEIQWAAWGVVDLGSGGGNVAAAVPTINTQSL